MTRHALVGAVSGELLSYSGRVLVHDDLAELGFLFPGVRVVPLPSYIAGDQTLPIAQHPEMASVRWPLRKDEFR